MITKTFRKTLLTLAVLAALGAAGSASAAVYVQCGPNNNGVATDGSIQPAFRTGPAVTGSAECMHLTAGDGFISMADGRTLYTFGFADVSAKPVSDVILDTLAATFAAPTIELQQGKDFYLTLTNVSMAMRPDLFDPHTVHFHGFPQQPPVFDGMPEGSFGVNMGSSVTYYYKLNDPGTYMYHCHQEATEHMQMGMLGNLYVKPSQDEILKLTNPAPNPLNIPKTLNGRRLAGYVYNDGNASTGYHKAYPLQLGSMDHAFHELHLAVQPLPFKDMKDTYPMINGRGYPDTVNPAPLPAPLEKAEYLAAQNKTADSSQPVSSHISVDRGERILLRMTNLNVTNYYTITTQGLPMKVVGMGARQLKGPTGTELYYDTASVTLGGGESAEVLIDTSQVAAGTYFLYTTNLNFLSNFEQDYGGMMTEIVIN
ncbi:multicopper oxidase domain-containing protein [Rhodoferax lacus]|nr:multicopper oxidase domain-containing protein [Rhodoferax lacus]